MLYLNDCHNPIPIRFLLSVPILRPWLSRTATTTTSTPAAAGAVTLQEGPERDLVNFPRQKRQIEKTPVRMGMFPEEWFTNIYEKTGATGKINNAGFAKGSYYYQLLSPALHRFSWKIIIIGSLRISSLNVGGQRR